jgi:hypothetical protein
VDVLGVLTGVNGEFLLAVDTAIAGTEMRCHLATPHRLSVPKSQTDKQL